MFKILSVAMGVIIGLSALSAYVFGLLGITGVGAFVIASSVIGGLTTFWYAGPALTNYLNAVGTGVNKAS